MTNEFGEKLDRNGYAASIMQDDLTRCWRCGRTDRKLDRHEVYGASNRDKSKALGLWVMLCHDACHEGQTGVHQNVNEGRYLKQVTQRCAMRHYGWSVDEFRRRLGKNWLE